MPLLYSRSIFFSNLGGGSSFHYLGKFLVGIFQSWMDVPYGVARMGEYTVGRGRKSEFWLV